MMIYSDMALQPKGARNKRGINSDLVLRYPFAERYQKGLPPEPGDIPTLVNISGRHGFPDAMSCGGFWVLSPRLLQFIRDANGPQWPLQACEITLASKSIGESSYRFLYGPPRCHRYNHDRQTYPTAKEPIKRDDDLRWVKHLGRGVNAHGHFIRPYRPGDPNFWEDPGVKEGDTLWAGADLIFKFVSDPVWELLNQEFPNIFRARHIDEKEIENFL
jgi:hypothetical protein